MKQNYIPLFLPILFFWFFSPGSAFCQPLASSYNKITVSADNNDQLYLRQNINITYRKDLVRMPYLLQDSVVEVTLDGLKPRAEYDFFVGHPVSNPECKITVSSIDDNKQFENALTFKAQHKKTKLKILISGKRAGGSTYVYISFTEKIIEKSKIKNRGVMSTNTSPSPSELILDFFLKGDCVQVSNIQYRGGSNQRGTFSNGNTSIGFQDGVILATGGISVASGPNNSPSRSVAPIGPDNNDDSDLSQLTGGNQFNVSVLEFDFIPSEDTISFQYVFASEEYCEYINAGFNDVFGFFISGPGISGPFSNGAQNIAIVPNTTTPVSIDNVNHISNPAYYQTNSPFNPPGFPVCNGHPTTTGPSVDDCQFDGFTKVLTAKSPVTPCETYHIKLAIADLGDERYDSGVFFKSNSFDGGKGSSWEVVYEAGDAAIEGCTGGYFVVKRPKGTEGQVYTETFSVKNESTATWGVDYSPFSTTVTIPANKDTIHIPINVLHDAITENLETIILNLTGACQCLSTEIEFDIQDLPVLNVDLEDETVCFGNTVTVSPSVEGGLEEYTYHWSNGSTDSEVTVSQEGVTDLIVTVTDHCGQSDTAHVKIDIIPQISAQISGDTTICQMPLGSAQLTIHFEGPGPWTFTIFKDGAPFQTITTSQNPYLLTVNQLGSYTIGNLVDASSNCAGIGQGSANISLATLNLNLTSTPFACEASKGSANVNASGGFPDYQFHWSNGSDDQSVDGLNAGIYTVTVTDTKGCINTGQIEVTPLPPLVANVGVIAAQNCNGAGSVSINVSGGTPDYDYEWNNGSKNKDLTGVDNGTYTVTITDTKGCSTTLNAVVPIDTIHPQANAGTGGLITCFQPNLTLNGTGSQGGNFQYNWTTPDGNIVSGGNTLTPVVNKGGTYILEVTNTTNGCKTTAQVEVDEDKEIPAVSAHSPDTLNCYHSTVTVDATGSSFGPNFTSIWTTSGGNIVSGQGTLVITVDKPGLYTYNVQNKTNGCTNSVSIIVPEDKVKPVAVAGNPNTIDCSHPTIDLNGNGSSSGSEFVYNWSTTNGNIITGETTLTPTVDKDGTYTILVTNLKNGCTQIASVTIAIDTITPRAVTGNDTLVNCYHPQITISGEGSSTGSNFSYTWTTTDGNIVSGQNTLKPVVNAGGTYVLTVKNNKNGCETASEIFVISDKTLPVNIITTPNTLTCFEPVIFVDASQSDFGDPYQLTWTTVGGNILDGQGTTFIQVDKAGTYKLTIVNTENGCSATAQVAVNVNQTKPKADAGPPKILTCSEPAVTLDGSKSNSGNKYEIYWTTEFGNIQSGDFTLNPVVNLPGLYFLKIIDTENGCESYDTVEVTVNGNIPVAIAAPGAMLNCYTASLELNGNGSSNGGPFKFKWTTTNGNFVSGQNTLKPIVNMSGVYQIEVTDTTNGCKSIDTVNVLADFNQPTPVITPPGLLNCSNPTLNLYSKGSPFGSQYKYKWTTSDGHILSGSEDTTLAIDQPGNYQLIIFNEQNGCADTSAVDVRSDFTYPDIDINLPDTITCSRQNVTIHAEGSSTGSDYEFSWSTTDGHFVSGKTTLTPVVSAGGYYILTIKHKRSDCIRTDSILVPIDANIPVAIAGTPDTLNCLKDTITLNGSITGTGNITYKWIVSNGGNIISGDSTLTPKVDASGTYSLEVTNHDNDCIVTSNVDISVDLLKPQAVIQPVVKIDCNNPVVNISSNGSVFKPAAIFKWKTSDGSIVGNQDSLNVKINKGGTYHLYITNQPNGCIDSASVVVLENSKNPNADALPEVILGCTAPQVTLDGSKSDKSGSIIYKWVTQDGNIVSGDTTLKPTVNKSGIYQLISTDTINGCKDTALVNVKQDLETPQVSPGPDQSLTCLISEVKLNGSYNGAFDSLKIEWTTSDGNIAKDPGTLTPTVDAPGTYVLIVINLKNGCADTASLTVEQLDNVPKVNIGAPDTVTCKISELDLDGTGSDNGGPLKYVWTTEGGVFISGQNSLSPKVGGSGYYTLTIIDTLSDCQSKKTVFVAADTSGPAINLTGDLLTCSKSFVEISSELTSDTTWSGYDIKWTTNGGHIVGSDNEPNVKVDKPGFYTISGSDLKNGCTSSYTIEVKQDNSLPHAVVADPLKLTCSRSKIDIDATGSTYQDPFVVDWKTTDGNIVSGVGTFKISVNKPGTYSIIIHNTDNGCVDSTDVTVIEDKNYPEAGINFPDTITCKNPEINVQGSSNPTANIDWTWSTQGGNITSDKKQQNITVVSPGVYQLIVKNKDNDCPDTISVEVFENKVYPNAAIGAPDTITCDHKEINLAGSTTNSVNVDIKWTTAGGNIISGDNTLNPLVNATGEYFLHIIDLINGCETIKSVVVNQDSSVPVALAGQPQTLTCKINSIQLNGSGSTGSQFTYEWKTNDGHIVSGANTLNPLIDKEGTYQLIVYNKDNDCESVSSVDIRVDKKPPLAESDAIVKWNCNTESALLDGSGSTTGANIIYEWQKVTGTITSGDDQIKATAGAQGQYLIIVTDDLNGCKDTAYTDVILDIPTPDLNVNSPLCPGFKGLIKLNHVNNGTPPYEYSFNNGGFNTQSEYKELEPGQYRLEIRDANGCRDTLILEIEAPVDFEKQLSGGRDTILLGESVIIPGSDFLPLDLIKSIKWKPGNTLDCDTCINPLASPLKSTGYELEIISREGCKGYGRYVIIVKQPSIYVPNIFSPNGDNINDKVTVFANDFNVVKVNKLMIYDRWGNVLFQNKDFKPNDLDNGWDGSFRGLPMDPAVFAWWAEAETITGEIIFAKGDLTLVR